MSFIGDLQIMLAVDSMFCLLDEGRIINPAYTSERIGIKNNLKGIVQYFVSVVLCTVFETFG